ncbi:stemmadenine O-acetyltransferase-like [Salvia splendens]|nr:stemmadenine O-acetyltransferase-like [Salvia splendens]
MVIEIKVISMETIKPSSPTPKSLAKYHLSFLDKLAPPIFPQLVYFYSSNPKIPNSLKSNHLKKSLSETLSTFYPLAGRLVGNSHVNCNDAGVPFAEAEANCNLSQIVTDPDPKNTSKFAIPQKALGLCLAVQVTYFRCGGTAVGIMFLHKIGDALSLLMFANAWSAATRGGGVPPPVFDAASYFPPRDIPGYNPTSGILKEEIEARIFRFPASKIAALRERYTAACGGHRPSRVEALSAFIWTQFISATGMKPDPNKIYAVLQTVNLRTRADPPLSEHHFGNIYGLSTARPEAGDGGVELLRKMREAVEAVDSGYVARLKDGEKHLEFMSKMLVQDTKGELVSFNFTSLCRLPLYEADFGWGKPVWVGFSGFPFKNLVTFVDTKSEGGIEALVNLKKRDMEKFQACLENLQSKL